MVLSCPGVAEVFAVRDSIQLYADTLYEKSLHESADALREARLEFGLQMAARRSATSYPVSGPEMQALTRLFVAHVERCMSSRLNSYRKAFDEADQLPTEEEFRKMLSDVKDVQNAQSRNSVHALTQFASTHGAKVGSSFDLTQSTAHAHDRNLQEWKVWRAQVNIERDVGGEDAKFARMAVDQAKLSVAEDDRIHPRVGVVVVQNGRVLAAAHRGETPAAHAEFIALEQKLRDVSLVGATVYTTLEPCTSRNHPKIPCAERLIGRKVKPVVIGMLDPDPKITGRGQRKLRTANIVTDFFSDALMAEVEELNREFARKHDSAEVGAPADDDGRKLAGAVADKWVQLGYERDAGVVKVMSEQGFELGWVSAEHESIKVDFEGWEYVLLDQPDGSKARLKVRDHPAVGGYLVLLKKRKT